MQSTLFISSNDTIPEDSGIYTCQVTLTVNNTDNFTVSDTSRVILTGNYMYIDFVMQTPLMIY